MKRTLPRLALAAAALAASCAAASADGPSIVSEMAEKALARGYGTSCSLDHRPVKSGGYYPCLDFGPYRYVSAYGKVHALVVQEGKAPFEVMSGAPDSPAWLYDGPWNEDMPARMVMWWNDTVEGLAASVEERTSASAEKKAAEEYIRTLRGEGAGQAESPATAPVPAPEMLAVPAPAAASAARTEEISPDIRNLLAAQ